MNPLFWYTSSIEEIWRFVSNREVYVKVLEENGYKPIKPRSKEDLLDIASRYSGLLGFYASPTIHKDKEIILGATPVWVIELLDSNVWKLGLDAAWLIIELLKRHNVRESVYLVYYDRFFEIRVHEVALKKVENPLDAAHRIVELVLRELKVKLQRLVYISGARIRVYNGLNGHLLIAPRSLYSANKASVYFKPDDIDFFEPSWVFTDEYRYNPRWDGGFEGEALELAKIASEKIRDDKKTFIALKETVGSRKIDRFQVMGLLQAARYYTLTGDLEKAKSFGYNRAVFYAWAKHYGRGLRAFRRLKEKPRLSSIEVGREEKWRQREVFGEPVMISSNGWYGMGEEEHTPEHFDKHIARKIELQVPFEVAWKAALEYVRRFPREVLMDQQKFFRQVYQPVRDSFIEDVLLKRSLLHKTRVSLKPRGRKETLLGKDENPRRQASKLPITTLDSFLKKQEASRQDSEEE